MTCVELERELEDLDDYSAGSAEMRDHLRACHSCNELIEDLSAIQREAANLVPVAEPSRGVWLQIQAQLVKEGLIAGEAKRGLLERWGLQWIVPARQGLSYALVFFMALSGVYVYSVFSPSVEPPSVAVVKISAPELEKVYQKAPPASREMYVANLQQVDSSIQQLQTFLASHPDDQFARDQLSTVYQQKSRLWEDMVRWQDLTQQLQPDKDLP